MKNKKRLKRCGISLSVIALLTLALFHPSLPWSARLRHGLNKSLTRTQIKLAAWKGKEPGLARVTGKLAAGGVQIEVLDSPSGWAATADAEGKFILPDVMWYPGARYELIITANVYSVKHIKITAPETLSESREFDIGEFAAEDGCHINAANLPGQNSITYLNYDEGNTGYYREAFEKITAGKLTGEEKFAALNARVSKKLKYEEVGWNYDSARPILERGSRYCGHLSFAMAAIAEAGNYKSRLINLSDGANAHTVVEVFYDDAWHLYDPTLALYYRNSNGAVASYKELRLDPGLIKQTVSEKPAGEPDEPLNWLSGVYASGFHHFYYFKKREFYCALWWPFKSGSQPPGSISLTPFMLMTGSRKATAVDVNASPLESKDFKACRQCDSIADYALRYHLPKGQWQEQLTPTRWSKLD
jgi:hypothetical protein